MKALISKPTLIFILSVSMVLALPLAIILFYSVSVVDIIWDWANLLGYLATGLFLLLFVYVSRPHVFPPFSRFFFTHFHRDIGIAALTLVLLHILLLLLGEPLLLEHLKITAPWYMLAGLAAAIFILLLVISSLPRYRQRLWPSYDVFCKVHKWVSLLIAVLIGVHLIGSDFYLNSVLKKVLLGIITLSLALYYFIYNKDRMAKVKNRIAVNKNSSTHISLLITVVLSLIGLLAVSLKHRLF